MKKNYSTTWLTVRLFLFLVLHGIIFTAKAELYPFSATYSGANEVPANGSAGIGTITGVYNDINNTIFYTA